MGGPIISGIGLSGSDSEDKESNLLWVSREAVVSNKDVEKFGKIQLIYFEGAKPGLKPKRPLSQVEKTYR